MSQYEYENFSDIEETESVNTDYEVDVREPAEKYGFKVTSFRAGSIVHSERYGTKSVTDQIPYHAFEEMVAWAVRLRQSTFRNLVVTIEKSIVESRMITISKQRALGKDPEDFVEGVLVCLRALMENHIDEAFECYDPTTKEFEEISKYCLRTSEFSVVYDQENSPSGGFVSETERTKNIEVEYPCNSRYGPMDCFFECLSHVTKKEYNVEKARKLMKAGIGLIAIRHIKRFERMINRKIVVFTDACLESEPVALYGGSGEIEDSAPVELALVNNHFYLYKGILLKDERKHWDVRPPGSTQVYIFYDFETYFCPKTYEAVPYAMAYYVCSSGKEPRTGCIVKDKVSDSIELQVMNFFNEFKEKHTILIGFNNGAFDDYILFNILSKYGVRIEQTLIDRGSRILSFKSEGLISKDAYRFFITSLRSATESFSCSSAKGTLDHEEVQFSVEHDLFTEWIKANRTKVIDYAIADVVSLGELYFKARRTFLEIHPSLDMDSSLTLSQMSMSAFQASIAEEKIKLPVVKDLEKENLIRKALVGGRCQIFNACEEKEHEVQSIDVVSLYPFVMMNRDFPYVKGKHRNGPNWLERVSFFCERFIGVYEVEVLSQPKDAIVPSRNEDGTLNWSPACPFVTWSDSVTLKCLRRHGGNFKVKYGFRFNLPTKNLFKKYLRPIMKKKAEQDYFKNLAKNHPARKNHNPALRSCLKLLMNSLSGKMGQKPIEKEKIICTSDPECDKAFKRFKGNFCVAHIRDNMWLVEGWYEDKDIKISSPVILAILIYAYAREYMYENFISRVEHKYGMDTDSLFLRTSELPKIDPELFGSNCGQVTIELNEKSHGIYVSKKIYANFTMSDGKEIVTKFRFKGIGENDRLVPNQKLPDIKKMIVNDNFVRLNEIWETLPKALSLETLRAILKNSKVHILCSQIRRIFKHSEKASSLTIKRKFVVKEFPSETFHAPM